MVNQNEEHHTNVYTKFNVIFVLACDFVSQFDNLISLSLLDDLIVKLDLGKRDQVTSKYCKYCNVSELTFRFTVTKKS